MHPISRGLVSSVDSWAHRPEHSEYGVWYIPKYVPLYVEAVGIDTYWVFNTLSDGTKVGPFKALSEAQAALTLIAEASND